MDLSFAVDMGEERTFGQLQESAGVSAHPGAGVAVWELEWLCGSCSGCSFPWGCVKLPGCCAGIVFQVLCAEPAVISLCDGFLPAKPFESGQYLDIYGISRDQAGEYECSAENDVSVPDVKKVKITVNCKCCSLLFPRCCAE